MTAIVSLLGIIGRFAGDLLDAATGWAGTLMFGRVPQSHRRYLAAIMGGSVLWVFLVIGFLLPGLLRWSLSTTPHPSFMTGSWLAFVVTLGVILVPLGVGAAAYLAPADGNRATGVRGLLELARGYVLAPVIGGLLIFLACVGLARKVRSVRHGWSDAHIPLVVPEHGYDDTVETVHGALSDEGIQVRVNPATRALSLPAWVLTHLAGPNIRRLQPDRLVELDGTDVRVGVYPSDVAISTTPEMRTEIRAAILAALASADAHLTMSAEAQKVEDRLKAMIVSAPGGEAPRYEPSALAAIDRTLLALDVPAEEWDVLYRLRLQAERDQLRQAFGGTVTAAAPAPAPAPAPAESTATSANGEGIDDGDARSEPRVAQVPAL